MISGALRAEFEVLGHGFDDGVDHQSADLVLS